MDFSAIFDPAKTLAENIGVFLHGLGQDPEWKEHSELYRSAHVKLKPVGDEARVFNAAFGFVEGEQGFKAGKPLRNKKDLAAALAGQRKELEKSLLELPAGETARSAAFAEDENIEEIAEPEFAGDDSFKKEMRQFEKPASDDAREALQSLIDACKSLEAKAEKSL